MNEVRFHIQQGDKVLTTTWEPENPQSAASRANELRQEYGNEAMIMVERRGHSTKPNRPTMIRFRIRTGDETYYSRAFQEKERDQVLSSIRIQFPHSDISEEQVNG